MSNRIKTDIQRLEDILGAEGQLTIFPARGNTVHKYVFSWRRTDDSNRRLLLAPSIEAGLIGVAELEEWEDFASGRTCAFCAKPFGADPVELGLRRTEEGYVCSDCVG